MLFIVHSVAKVDFGERDPGDCSPVEVRSHVRYDLDAHNEIAVDAGVVHTGSSSLQVAACPQHCGSMLAGAGTK